jgi:uncharacterized protein
VTAAPRLILFARYPTAGACKTRLIPALGPEGAAALHRHLTERTVGILRKSAWPVTVTVAYTGADIAAFERWLGDGIFFSKQADGDLTAKLLACLKPGAAIFFGADTPDLQSHHVASAIAGLETHDVVIGPAEDGGYYLIGMREPRPELFVDMPWSTEHVLPETLRRLKRLSIQPLMLELLSDCDRPEDLSRWPDLAV